MWHGDGTFGVVPTLYYQLYILHGYVSQKALPLVFILLTRKTEAIYTHAFSARLCSDSLRC